VHDLQVVEAFAKLVVGRGPIFFLLDFLEKRFGFFRVVPEAGRLALRLFVGDLPQLVVDVKDASSTHPCAPQAL